MGTLSTPGIGSGLDVEAIVQATVDTQIAVRESKIESEEEQNQIEISAFGQLQSDINTYRTSLLELQRQRDFTTPIVNSSDSSIATATGFAGANVASYSLRVDQLATAQSVATSNSNFTSETSIVGGGTLTIETGRFNSGETAFEGSPTVTSTDISIATDATLTEVRNAINSANAGVTASIISDDTTAYLVITSDNTGADNAFRITAVDDDGNNTDNSGLSSLVYDTFAGGATNATRNVQADNNSFELNGLSLSTASNTLSNVIEGLSIELESADNTKTITLDVENDTETVKERISEFVDATNTIFESLNELMKYEMEEGELVIGDLFGDSIARSIQSGIRSMFNNPVEYLDGELTSLVELGIGFQQDGSVELDETTLDELLTNNFQDVANLLSFTGAPTDSLIEIESVSITNTPGSYDLIIDDVQSIASSSSENFTSASDVISGGTLTIAVGSYGTGKTTFTPTTTYSGIAISAGSTLTDVRDAINASAAAVAVTASIITENDEARLVLTGDNSGPTNAFQVTVSGDTDGSDTDNQGLSSLVYDPTTSGTNNAELLTDVFKLGTSLSGTLNSVALTSSDGFILDGSGSDFNGLALAVNGGSAGARGSINISKGAATRLDEFLDSYVDAVDGVLTQKLNTLNDEAADLSLEREDLSDYRERLERIYFRQFTALDVFIAESQNISSFLTQQFTRQSTNDE